MLNDAAFDLLKNACEKKLYPVFALLFFAIVISMTQGGFAYANTLSAANSGVANEPESVFNLGIGTYYSYDVTGDAVPDSVTVKATKLPDSPNGVSGGYERGSFSIIVNGKTVLTDNTGGFVRANVQLITLRNKKTFINVLLSNYSIDGSTLNALFQYKNGYFKRVYNLENLAGNYGYNAKIGDAYGDYGSAESVVGNTVIFNAYNAKASSQFTARFRYIGGTLKRIAAADPSKPKVSSARSLQAKSLTVKTSKAKRATGYQFKIARDKKYSKGVATKTTKSTKATFSGLKKGKKYYVKVRAYKKAYGQRAYGKWSKTKVVKVRSR